MTSAAGSLWRPVSSCGAGCLPRSGAVARARRVARLAALIGVLAGLIVSSPVLLLRRRWLRVTFVRLSARGILAALRVRLVVCPQAEARGAVRRTGVLLVSNHISWLDVVAVLATVPEAVMLAKREVRDWPLVGAVAAATGTIFVDRSRPRALPGTVADVARALRAGAVVAAFPEGTTWCGSAVGRFRPALFQAVLDSGAGVLPVSLNYQAADAPTTVAAFLGTESLWSSVRRVAAVRELTVRVGMAGELYPPGTAGPDRGSGSHDIDRRALALMAEAHVRPAAAQLAREDAPEHAARRQARPKAGMSNTSSGSRLLAQVGWRVGGAAARQCGWARTGLAREGRMRWLQCMMSPR